MKQLYIIRMEFTVLILFFWLLHQCSADKQISPENQIKRDVGKGVVQLGISMNKELLELTPEDNVIISPLNIYSVLSLAMFGSAGSTLTELLKVLGLESYKQRPRDTYSAISSALQSVNKTTLFAKTYNVHAVFLQKKYLVYEQYRNDVAEYLKGHVESVDFENDGENAVRLINKWVSLSTDGEINDIYKNPLSSDTKAVFASAFYFKAKWRMLFIGDSFPGEFMTPNGNISISFLLGRQMVIHGVNDRIKYEVIGLPYEEEEYILYMLLPFKEQTVRNITSHFTIKDFQDLYSMGYEEINYQIPKFQNSFTADLIPPLMKLGVHKPFESLNADFSKMSKGVHVKEVKHKTELRVMESGTVAAAVSSIRAVPRHYISKTVIVDRPFIFFITPIRTLRILFSGVINKPTKL